MQELDEKLCKHSREHWLGMDCLQELCFFFSPESDFMHSSRATGGANALFAMIWMWFGSLSIFMVFKYSIIYQNNRNGHTSEHAITSSHNQEKVNNMAVSQKEVIAELKGNWQKARLTILVAHREADWVCKY